MIIPPGILLLTDQVTDPHGTPREPSVEDLKNWRGPRPVPPALPLGEPLFTALVHPPHLPVCPGPCRPERLP